MKNYLLTQNFFKPKWNKNLCRGVDSYNNDDRYKRHHHRQACRAAKSPQKVAQESPTQPNTNATIFIFCHDAIVGNKSHVQSMRPG